MFTYRIYVIDGGNHVAGPPTVVECDDDEAALTLARQAVDGRDVEVWHGGRLVARLRRDEP